MAFGDGEDGNNSLGGKTKNLAINEDNGAFNHIWSGAGTTNAPTNAVEGAVGANNDGAATGNVYVFNNLKTWVDTGQTVEGYFGV
jgi:hypothetical protein